MKKSAAALLIAVLASGCASWHRLRPGQTETGLALRVSSHEPQAARREAVETVLPLFLADATRPHTKEILDREVFARLNEFVGRERLPRHGMAVVEVLPDKLAPVLLASGLARPREYASGQEKVLVALGRADRGLSPAELVVGDAMRMALFGAGLQARDLHDAFDPATKDKDRLVVLPENVTVAAAARGGWSWVETGSVVGAVGRDVSAAIFRGEARLDGRFYELGFSSAPYEFSIEESAVDVSTGGAFNLALEQVGQKAATRIQERIAERRDGRTNIAFMLPGPKSVERIRGLLAVLRRVPGVEGATLYAWNGPYESVDVWAYVHGLTPEDLVARLMHADPSLNVTGIDSELREIFIEAPMPGLEQ
jgi:hypothetical protein